MLKKTITKFLGFSEDEKNDIRANSQKIVSHMMIKIGYFECKSISNLVGEFISYDERDLFEVLKKYVPSFENLSDKEVDEIFDDEENFEDFVDKIENCLNENDLYYVPSLDDFKRVFIEDENDLGEYHGAICGYLGSNITTAELFDFLHEKELLEKFFSWYQHKHK